MNVRERLRALRGWARGWVADTPVGRRLTPEGRAEAVRNAKKFAWAAADVLVHVAICLGVTVIAGGAWARDVWRELRDRRDRCSKCGTRCYVRCEVCYDEVHHRGAT